MKKKTLYLFALICCMSLFSSAGQNGKNCGDKSGSRLYQCPKTIVPKAATNNLPDFAPMGLLIFNI